MATVSGTVSGVHLINSPFPSDAPTPRKTYLLSLAFGTYTSGDTASITGVPTAIATATKNGKTFTVRGYGACGGPGRTAAGVAVYSGLTITNASGTLTFSLTSYTGADASAGPSTGVQVIVTGDEA